MTEEYRLLVRAEEEGERVDRLLARRLDSLSRARLQSLISEGRVRLDDAPCERASTRVRAGQRLEVMVPEPVSPADAPRPQDLGLPVLYQDDAVLVAAKPAGMAVHPGPGTPEGTVVNAVLHLVPDLPGIGGEIRPGIVHRLDKDTTGVLVVAKTDAALAGLQAQFKARTVEKIYLALVHGVPRFAEGVLDAPLARHPRDRKRFTGQGTDERPDARAARTRWARQEVFEGATLLEVTLETGRTHQIRVHLSEAGHPLLGDGTYGGTRRDRTASSAVQAAATALGHQALHALRLAFDHPVTGERMCFEAPLPDEWQAALAALRSAALPQT